jgi:hypothetical protein
MASFAKAALPVWFLPSVLNTPVSLNVFYGNCQKRRLFGLWEADSLVRGFPAPDIEQTELKLGVPGPGKALYRRGIRNYLDASCGGF